MILCMYIHVYIYYILYIYIYCILLYILYISMLYICVYIYIISSPLLSSLRGWDSLTVWLWYLLVNLDIYSSPFYLATAQSQCLMVIGSDGGMVVLTLCSVSQLWVCLSAEGAKNISFLALAIWLWNFMVNLDIYLSI